MQADAGQDFFELFGLPARFGLDAADLAVRYRELQRQFHPDRYASRPVQERRLALQLTARINEAFQVLKDPVARGRYLLALRGIDTAEERDTAMDPAFLIEQMELREALEDARRTGAARDGLVRIAERVGTEIENRTRALSDCLDKTDVPPRARALVRELQFLAKLRAEIEESLPID